MRYCEECNKEIIGRPKEQRFCSKSCAASFNSYKLIELNTHRFEEKQREYEINPKLCNVCQKPCSYEQYVYGKHNPKFCSKSCSAIFNNKFKKKKERKRCLHCGEILKSRNVVFCGPPKNCNHSYSYSLWIAKWLNNELDLTNKTTVPHIIKKFLFKEYNNSCQECGWNKINSNTQKTPLQVHHIDGNWRNNSRENLQLLCPNCHSLTNTYCGIKRSGGRPNRQNARLAQSRAPDL